MKKQRSALVHARRMIARLLLQINTLKSTHLTQRTKANYTPLFAIPSLHELEVRERMRRDSEDTRLLALKDTEFKAEMTEVYGRTRWSSNLIAHLLEERLLKREVYV